MAVAAEVRDMGGQIERTRVPESVKRDAFALNLAEEDGEGEMWYYCGHSQISSTTTIQAECDESCAGGAGGDKYRKMDVQLCHKWACSNQTRTGNWGAWRANHEVVVCCNACHRKIDQDLGRAVVWD